jgi:hypothetical protein
LIHSDEFIKDTDTNTNKLVYKRVQICFFEIQ